MAEFRADLHCHSDCSDGTDSPQDLLRKAKAIGLQGLSITDHDTVAAYTPELFLLAQTLAIRVISGVEISSELERMPVHILGYGCDLKSLPFAAFLTDLQAKRVERNRSMLKLLAKRKMPIEEAEFGMFKAKIIGRPHMAFLMVKKGYVKSIQEAFEKYLKDGAACYASGFKYAPSEAIAQIKMARGKAVLAHPHFYKKGDLLKQLLTLPFDGIECHYAALPKALELPWVKLAAEKGWVATGGSDYHGASKNIALGASWVNEKTFNILGGNRDGC